MRILPTYELANRLEMSRHVMITIQHYSANCRISCMVCAGHTPLPIDNVMIVDNVAHLVQKEIINIDQPILVLTGAVASSIKPFSSKLRKQ